MAIKYFCDCCGKEVTKDTFANAKFEMSDKLFVKDVCDACSDKIIKFLAGGMTEVSKTPEAVKDVPKAVVPEKPIDIPVAPLNKYKDNDEKTKIINMYNQCVGINKIAHKMNMTRSDVKVILKSVGYNICLTEEEQKMYDAKYSESKPKKVVEKRNILDTCSYATYEKVKKLAAEGKSRHEIADELNVNYSSLTDYIRKTHIVVTTRGIIGSVLPSTEDNINKIKALAAEGLTCKQMAKHLEINIATLRDFVKRNNIEVKRERAPRNMNRSFHYENMPRKANYVIETDREGFIKDIKEA